MPEHIMLEHIMLEHIMLEHMSNKLSEYMSNRMFQRVGVSVFLVHCHVYYQKAIEQIDIYIVYIYSIYIL